jgi:O-antigen/teichoic acid export membrane protein
VPQFWPGASTKEPAERTFAVSYQAELYAHDAVSRLNKMLQIIRRNYFTRGMADLISTFSAHSVGVLVGLSMQSLLAWTLGAEGRGEYAICLIFSSLLAVILVLGADGAVSYYISTKEYSRNSILSFTVLYFCIVACLALLILPYITELNIVFLAKVSGKALHSAILWTVSLIAFRFCNSILSGMREFNLLAKLIMSKVTFTLIASFALLKTTHLDIRAPIIADTLSGFGGALIVFSLLIRKFNYRWKWPNLQLARKLMNYSLRAFAGTIGMIANARIFALSMSFLSQLISISDVTARIIQPRIAVSQDGRHDLVALCARLIGLLVLVSGVMLIIFANIWIPILFSAEFLPIIPIIVILIPGIWLRVVGKILYPYFNGIDRPEIVSISTFINFVSNLLILLMMLEPYGLKGAAWATTISYSLSTMYVIRQYLNITGCSLPQLFVIQKQDFYFFINQFLRFKA